MTPSRSLVVVAGLLVALLSGCKSQCRQLTEKLCDCAETTILKQQCLTDAATKDSSYGSNPTSENICHALLTGEGSDAGVCDCHQLSTPEGKRACGLARQ